MTKYLVTNIKFTSKDGMQLSGSERIHDFKVPADIKDIHDWLADSDFYLANTTAYAVWIRSCMFYNYTCTYDFIEIDSTVNQSETQAVNQLFLADLADMSIENTVDKIVDINIPQLYIADLTVNDLAFADNDIEQAIFENMLNNLSIEIKVHTLSSMILEAISDCMTERNAGCPNTIAEHINELIMNDVDDHTSEDIWNAIHSFCSSLVTVDYKDEPTYR